MTQERIGEELMEIEEGGRRRRIEGGGGYTRRIEKRVEQRALQKWKAGVESKTTLEYYKIKEKPGREKFYDGGKGSNLLFKARTGSLETNARTWRWNGGQRNCIQCDTGGEQVEENIQHIITECEKYEEERMWLDIYMRDKLGEERWAEEKESEMRGVDYVLGFREMKEMEGTKRF